MEEGWKTDPFDCELAHASKVSFSDTVPEITLGDGISVTDEVRYMLRSLLQEDVERSLLAMASFCYFFNRVQNLGPACYALCAV